MPDLPTVSFWVVSLALVLTACSPDMDPSKTIDTPEPPTPCVPGETWEVLGEMVEGEAGALAFHDGALIHTGGWSSSGTQAGVRASEDGVEWVEVGTLPGPIQHHALLSAQGSLWVLGGDTGGGGTTSDAILRSDDGGASWTQAGTLPEPRTAFGWVPLDDGGYIVGGFLGDLSNLASTESVLRATIEGDSWTFQTLASLPEARAWAPAGLAGDRIILAGGLFGASPSTSVFAYDPQTDTWTEGPPLPTPGFRMTGIQTPGGMVLAGGDAPDLTAAVWRIGPDLILESLPALRNPRSGGVGWYADGGLHFARGFTPQGAWDTSGRVFRLDHCP